MTFTLKQLRYLSALAEAAHFGRAAATVNVSQPALSVQIRELEAALGVRLVERGAPRGGAHAGGARDRAPGPAHPRRGARDRAGGAVGPRPRRAAEDRGDPDRRALPAALGAAAAARPQPVARSRSARGADRAAGRGAARRARSTPRWWRCRRRRPTSRRRALFEDRFLLAGSAGRLEALGAGHVALRPEDMESGQLLLLDDGHCLTEQALAACAVDRARPRMDLRAASLTTLCRLVSEGFGLTLLPELAAQPNARPPPGSASPGSPTPSRSAPSAWCAGRCRSTTAGSASWRRS